MSPFCDGQESTCEMQCLENKNLKGVNMSNNEMKAVRVYEYGGPDVLKLEEAPCPEPGEGQVLVRIYSAGVNPADWQMRSGYYRSFMTLPIPWIPGVEGAGEIAGLGPGVTQFTLGQPVYGPIMGSYAEYAVAAVGDLQGKPAQLSFDEAASIPMGALTAWNAVVEAGKVQPGQRVLVQGAAGGVGHFAVGLALWKAAKVFGTTSTANLDFVRSQGAEAIDYTAGPVEDKVEDIDVVIDTVGGEIPKRSLATLKRGGTLVSVTTHLPEDFGREKGIHAMYTGRANPDRLKEITHLVEAGKLAPVVYKVFPLAEARQAQELSQAGHGHGRIVLRVIE